MVDNMTGDELTRRLNTIAINAVREAQIAIGRGDYPWVDDDWRRQHMIAQILELVRIESIDGAREHYPLTAPYQAPKNPQLDQIGAKLVEALAGLPLEESEQSSDPASQGRRSRAPKPF